MAKKKDKTAALFAAYIQKRRVLVADTNSSSRAGISRTLTGLGAKTQNLIMANTYEVAEAELRKSKPHVVVCDFDLGKQCGLNLLQEQRKAVPETKECLFILVTGNTSQSAVAQAAEEDIDTYILKPYTIEQFRQQVIKATLAKIYPNDYVKSIDEGKKHLFSGEYDQAIPIFQKAMKLDPKPALACFYLGQANLLKKLMDDAHSAYDQGININKIHYKCLVGLFELLLDRKENKEAYDIVKRLSRYFPANPHRLTQVLRLAIMTQSYEDIERYYQSFVNLDTRNDNLVKYVCAALVVTGKYYLQTNVNSRALELFKKAAVSAAGRTKMLREIIVSLLEYDLPKQASEYLARFPSDTHQAPDFQTCEYLVSDRSLAPTASVEKGRNLIKAGVNDPAIYETLIKRSAQCGLTDSADELAAAAKKAFPPMSKLFDKALAAGSELSAEAGDDD